MLTWPAARLMRMFGMKKGLTFRDFPVDPQRTEKDSPNQDRNTLAHEGHGGHSDDASVRRHPRGVRDHGTDPSGRAVQP